MRAIDEAFLKAAHESKWRTCRKLIKEGADPNAVARREEVPLGKRYLAQPALHHAITRPNFMLLMVLFQAGADPTTKDARGKGPVAKMVKAIRSFMGPRAEIGPTAQAREHRYKQFREFRDKQRAILKEITRECVTLGKTHQLNIGPMRVFDPVLLKDALSGL